MNRKHLAVLLAVCVSCLVAESHASQPTDWLLKKSTMPDPSTPGDPDDVLAPCISPGGEEGAFNIHYWNRPPTVRANEPVRHRIAWERVAGNPGAVLYLTVIADWKPNQPLVTLVNGGFQSLGETQVGIVEFNAPSLPGTYRIRWIMASAFQAVTKFYSAQADPNPVWCEIVFTVQ